MSIDQEARTYVVRILKALGVNMEKYEQLLNSTPSDRVIDGLNPWAFDQDPERAIGFCSEAVGRPVLPFSQAVGEDTMACFEAAPGQVPSVIVINPWAENKAEVVLAELPDFEAWLVYAKQISQEVQARERDEADKE